MAVLTTALALALALLATPFTRVLPVEIFFSAVILSLWFGGRGPGLLALSLAIFLLDFFFLPPLYEFSLGTAELLRIGIFSLLVLLIHFLLRTRSRLETNLRLATEEMYFAGEMQKRLFPTQAPVVPGFDLAGVSYPVRATGGDYFDFFVLKNGAIGFTLGDVSGHGLGPALLMASLRAYLRVLTRTREDVGEILSIANRLICEDATHEAFITVFFGCLNPTRRELLYASAGHPGYLLSRSGDFTLLDGTGPPLGINPAEVYRCAPPVTLDEEQMILLLSDGITEAASLRGRPFGLAHALDVVRFHWDDHASGIARALCQTALAFPGPGKQKDDISAVVLKVQAAW
jgi:sigma-B regulation protein RsbU (phosphoserine phosphatase)